MSGPAEWLTAIGTIGAVIVALFGERLRALLAAPRLEIRLGEGGADGIRVGESLTESKSTLSGAGTAFA
jgi:hypothetical protein